MIRLRIENVSYRYKNAPRPTISGVNCEFEAGCVTAVIGPSGSGKSTLLSLLAGLDSPSEGRVQIDGEDLSNKDLDRYRREDVAVIFQAFQLFPLLTALENVSYPSELVGETLKAATARAIELLRRVGIMDEKHGRYPAKLSGGEQQRVAIARALASGARILLADEPTGNLDGENSRGVVELLTQLAHDDGYCVVIVTHDPAIAEVSDKVYRMEDGRLREVRKTAT